MQTILVLFFMLSCSLSIPCMAKENKSRNEMKSHRISIYTQTQKAVDKGFYVGESFVKLDPDLTRKMIDQTERKGLHNAIPVPATSPTYQTQFIFAEQDTLDMAESFINEGLNPAALNLANPRNPGGGVQNGSSAQEESLFRRTNYFLALLPRKAAYYPIQGPEVIYTPCVQVFRTSEEEGCAFRKPFSVAIIACAAIDLRTVSQEPGDYETRTKNKISVLLRTALEKGHDSVVLGAMGCGAFRNDPDKMAGYFAEILHSDEFKGRFKKVGFAILFNQDLLENFRGQIMPKDIN